jgi:hypothetical protein
MRPHASFEVVRHRQKDRFVTLYHFPCQYYFGITPSSLYRIPTNDIFTTLLSSAIPIIQLFQFLLFLHPELLKVPNLADIVA